MSSSTAWSELGQNHQEILQIFGGPVTVMATEGKGRKKSSPRGFYSRVLEEAEKVELEEASHVEGIDEEIALLRVELRKLLEKQPERIDLHFETANIIARLVKTRYQINKEQKKSLKEAIQKVLTELALPLGVGVGIGLKKI
jgi:hypothetical protein